MLEILVGFGDELGKIAIIVLQQLVAGFCCCQ